MPEIDDESKFIVQRRNLLVVSVAILLVICHGVNLDDFGFLGIRFNFPRPFTSMIIMILVWMYFLARFYQSQRTWDVDEEGINLEAIHRLTKQTMVKKGYQARGQYQVEHVFKRKDKPNVFAAQIRIRRRRNVRRTQRALIDDEPPDPGMVEEFELYDFTEEEYRAIKLQAKKFTIINTHHLLEYYFPYGIAYSVPFILLLRFFINRTQYFNRSSIESDSHPMHIWHHSWHHGDWLVAIGIVVTSFATIGAVWAAWRFTRGDANRINKSQALQNTWSAINRARFSASQYYTAHALRLENVNYCSNEMIIDLLQRLQASRVELGSCDLLIQSVFGTDGFPLSKRIQNVKGILAAPEVNREKTSIAVQEECNKCGFVIFAMTKELVGLGKSTTGETEKCLAAEKRYDQEASAAREESARKK